MKTRDPGDEIENEVTNSEPLNSETFFSQATCKVASFPLVLDLMQQCYIVSFPDVFHFLYEEVLALSRTTTYQLAKNL